MLKPIIAIIGKTNVGKSQLFNRIIGKKISIVDNINELTRDRIIENFLWRNINYEIIDTGGINFNKYSSSELESHIKLQSLNAIEAADIIFFVTEHINGCTNDDIKICHLLHKFKKKVILIINKNDNPLRRPETFYDFYKLGLGDPILISAIHGYNIGDLLDICHEYVISQKKQFINNNIIDNKNDVIKISLVGKPNVGKSSIVNHICEENRVIVSSIAGTTRDSINITVYIKNKEYILIDTAGLRKHSKIDNQIEKYSRLRTTSSIYQSNICLIIIDAEMNITEQDTKIAGVAYEANKPCIIVVNKYDLINDSQKQYCINTIKEKLAYLHYAPIIFTSVIYKKGFKDLFCLINNIYDKSKLRITTGQLNNLLHSAILHTPPPTSKGKRLKIYYITQVAIQPITFAIFCNSKELFHFSYIRYLENYIRKSYDFTGNPIIFKIKESHKYD